MVSVRNANAMAEVIYYLKGIKQEDIDKIPKKFIKYLNENASKEYKCDFDYNKPLKDLKLLDETRGIIGMICYNYWCVTEIEKKQYLKKLNENEEKYQEALKKKYNPNNLFSNQGKKTIEQENANIKIIEYKETILKKIIKIIKKFLKK